MIRALAIALLLAGPALATPGDVYDPDTGTWGPPEKPRPETPGKPSRDPQDRDHRGVPDGYLCTAIWDGQPVIWSHGQPAPDAVPDRKCSCFDHPKGATWRNWCGGQP